MRAPEIPNADPEDQPTWNIWLYDSETDSVNRIITSDITAEAGQDIAPRIMGDDRIVFASTRQRQSKAILLDEGKPQFSAQEEGRNEPAVTLHVMNDDGSDIHQISFNQSHDLDPNILADGRLIYSRWDQVANRDRISLYSMNPDGSNQQMLYGAHSHDTGPNGETIEFMKPQELPDGRILVQVKSTAPQVHAGANPVAIDTAAYTDINQPTFDNLGLLTPGQEDLVPGDIRIDDQISPRGRFSSIYPLNDGTPRTLVSWSQCRVIDPGSDPLNPQIIPCTDQLLADPTVVEAAPLYGVWMFDLDEETQQPIVVPEEGFAYSESLVMEDKVSPAVILDGVAGVDLDADLVSEGVGILHIRSVYDFDGTSLVDIPTISDPAVVTADQRPARFLRIVKAVSIPDDDLVDLNNTAFGRSNQQLMREIIGYVPIEPDGSVKVKIPANIAFAISVLDANGRRISERHQNWLQLRPGEEQECKGCHASDSEMPHGRYTAQAPSANPGAPVDGSPFPNTEPALFANAGDSMAETYTRINGVPSPRVDIVFDDVWTDPAVRAKDPSFSYVYSDLSSTAPVPVNCVTNWTSECRIRLNYETIIHPLWGVDRQVIDPNDGVTVLADNTCNTCHSPTDAMGAAKVPDAQLDLSDGTSPDEADHFNSYRELLFPDNSQIEMNGALLDELVQATDANGNPLFEVDENGDLILDANGDPIPVLVPIAVQPVMSVAGAIASDRFFSEFDAGGTHSGRLSPAELKLIAEWLDIGAQYYNNPFDVPQ